MAVLEYTVKVKLADKDKGPRWTPGSEARNIETVVRDALREEYGKNIVRGVRAAADGL
jgi:hypothetical protein